MGKGVKMSTGLMEGINGMFGDVTEPANGQVLIGRDGRKYYWYVEIRHSGNSAYMWISIANDRRDTLVTTHITMSAGGGIYHNESVGIATKAAHSGWEFVKDCMYSWLGMKTCWITSTDMDRENSRALMGALLAQNMDKVFGVMVDELKRWEGR